MHPPTVFQVNIDYIKNVNDWFEKSGFVEKFGSNLRSVDQENNSLFGYFEYQERKLVFEIGDYLIIDEIKGESSTVGKRTALDILKMFFL